MRYFAINNLSIYDSHENKEQHNLAKDRNQANVHGVTSQKTVFLSVYRR